jgi:hypothetical protein
MTDNIPEMNREMCEHLGIPRHEHLTEDECNCGKIFWGDPVDSAVDNHIKESNPDFTSDFGKIRLLREMERTLTPAKFTDFLYFLGATLSYFIRYNITDETPEGKVRLLRAALEFMEVKK